MRNSNWSPECFSSKLKSDFKKKRNGLTIEEKKERNGRKKRDWLRRREDRPILKDRGRKTKRESDNLKRSFGTKYDLVII